MENSIGILETGVAVGSERPYTHSMRLAPSLFLAFSLILGCRLGGDCHRLGDLKGNEPEATPSFQDLPAEADRSTSPVLDQIAKPTEPSVAPTPQSQRQEQPIKKIEGPSAKKRPAQKNTDRPRKRPRASVDQNKIDQSNQLYLEALAASQNGESAEAIKICKSALALNPDNLQALRMLDRLQSKMP